MLSFCKIDILENFRKIHMKTPVPESLFNRVTGLLCVTLFKKKLRHRCFPVNVAKFSRTPFQQKPPGDCFQDE